LIANGHGYGVLPLSSILREVEAGTLAYSPLQHSPRRTLVMSGAALSRSPRILAQVQSVLDEVLCELHRDGRIFGELRIPQARARSRAALLQVA
jgi:hypothetical protein